MRQRGQAQLYVIAATAIVMLLMLAAIHYYKSKYEVVEAQFESFKDKTAALGEAAKAVKAKQEAEDAKRITAANTERDDALKRMRDAEANARRSRMPLTPAAASGSDQICFGQKALSAAVERYRGGIFRLVTQGDECAIDAKTLIDAWPKPITSKPPP